MGAEAMNVLLQTLGRFWPGSSPEIGALTGQGATHEGLDFFAVPSARAPRLLVPCGRRSAAAAMSRYSAALSVSDIAKRLLVGTAMRAGGGRFFSDHVRVVGAASETGSLREYLEGILGRSVTFSLGVGPLRANRKPVLQIFDATGRSLAYAKIGDSEISARDVRGEVSALRTLAEAEWHSLEVPRLLHSGEWNGLVVLVMSALPTSPLQPPHKRSTPPMREMVELSSKFEVAPRPFHEGEWWTRSLRFGRQLEDPELRGTYLEAADRILELADGRSWATGAWHGDWTPWNMAWRRGRLQVWDWERFEVGIPVGFDRLHYVVNERVRRHGTTVPVIHSALTDASDDRPSIGSNDHVLAAGYLFIMAGRYLNGAQGDGGGAVRERALVTLGALDQWLEQDV